jgi:hypothetical protein
MGKGSTVYCNLVRLIEGYTVVAHLDMKLARFGRLLVIKEIRYFILHTFSENIFKILKKA